MEHNPFISFEDGLEITYSDLKKNDSGADYIKRSAQSALEFSREDA